MRVAEEALENTNVRAPFDGVVIKKRAEVGETVSPFGVQGQSSREGGAIATIADLGELEVQTEVSENSVAKLTPAMPAEVKLQAYQDQSLQGAAAADLPVRGSRQGDRRSARHDSQRRRPRQAGDDSERHLSGKGQAGDSRQRRAIRRERAGDRRERIARCPAPIVLIPKRTVTEQGGSRRCGWSPARPPRAGPSMLGRDRLDQVEVGERRRPRRSADPESAADAHRSRPRSSERKVDPWR